MAMEPGKTYSYGDVVMLMADHFNLTEQEKTELLPSGNQPVFRSRVGWAKSYLKNAGLIEQPKRGALRISARGIEVQKQNLGQINNKYLMQFPEFQDFMNRSRVNRKHAIAAPESADDAVMEEPAEQSPDDLIAQAYMQIRQQLAIDLLSYIRQAPPAFFERLVVQLLVKMGYGGTVADAGRAIGRSGDGGIDGVIKEDVLGLDVIYVQAKRYREQGTIGRPDIQQFVGALAGHSGAHKGVFITTSAFSREAREFTARTDMKIVLIDGEQLAQLMIDYNLGVTVRQVYEVKRIDTDYFEGDAD